MKNNGFTMPGVAMVVAAMAFLFLSPRTLLIAGAAVRKFSASVAPTSTLAGQTQSYTFTLANDSQSDHNIKSAKISIPSGFMVSGSVAMGGGASNWSVSTTTSEIQMKKSSGSDIVPGGSFTVALSARATSTIGTYVWTSRAWDGTNFNGSEFTSSTQPSVVVLAQPTLRVNKVVVPANDLGRFNLRIDGATAGTGANVGDGGATGAVVVTVDTHTVSETAASSTSLSDYTSVISGDCAANGSVTLAVGENKICTITNIKRARLTVEKTTIGGTGTFHFTASNNAALDITTQAPNSTVSSFFDVFVDIGGLDFTVTETAAALWAADQTNCGVNLKPGDTKTCSFTNTRLGSIQIVKVTNPHGVGGEFPFSISGNATSGTQTIFGESDVTFPDLLPGIYTIGEIVPGGWDLTSATCGDEGQNSFQNGGSYTVEPGEDVVCTFINTKRGSITITKISDPNQGTFGFTLTNLGDQSTQTSTITVGGNGSNPYTFSNLLAGNYSVAETSFPDGWQGTSNIACENGAVPENIQLAAGESMNCIINNTKYGSISGMKFQDLNADGKNNEEPGIAGLTITLTKASDEDCDDCEDPVSLTTITDVSGNYVFINLQPGTYEICESPQRDSLQSFPAPGVSCGNGSNGYNVELAAGENLLGKDFGNYQIPKIIGYKWHDLNGDGVRQKELESTKADWPIALGKVLPPRDGSTATATVPIEIVALSLTGADGKFSLPVTAPGEYKLLEAKSESWRTTNPPARDSFFDIFYDASVSPGDTHWNTNSFFDVFVDAMRGTEIVVDKNEKPLTFGNINFVDILGAKVAPQNGSTSSTPSGLVLEAALITVSNGDGSTSTISLPQGTSIAKSSGENMDLALLDASSTTPGSLSGLGSGVVVAGALRWGIPGTGLVFSSPITINLFVGSAYDGQTLNVVRSPSADSGWTSDGIASPATCTVTSGLCTFSATKASYYAATTPPPASPSSSSGSSGGGGGGTGYYFSSAVSAGSSGGSPPPTPPTAAPPVPASGATGSESLNMGATAPAPPIARAETSIAKTENAEARVTNNPPAIAQLPSTPNVQNLEQNNPPEDTVSKPLPLLASIANIVTFGTGNDLLGSIFIFSILFSITYGLNLAIRRKRK